MEQSSHSGEDEDIGASIIPSFQPDQKPHLENNQIDGEGSQEFTFAGESERLQRNGVSDDEHCFSLVRTEEDDIIPSRVNSGPAGKESEWDEEEEEKKDQLPSDSSGFASGRGRQRSQKPGVILLGRGNSFSLGRSEVMLLHTNRRTAQNASNGKYPNANSDLNNSPPNSTVEIQTVDSPVSNGLSHTEWETTPPFSDGGSLPEPAPSVNGQRTMAPFDTSELELLWQQAESIMAAKRNRVQTVLEEFGVGEPGEEEEEEDIWQVVQDNFQV